MPVDVAEVDDIDGRYADSVEGEVIVAGRPEKDGNERKPGGLGDMFRPRGRR